MTPAEFREALATLGISHNKAARILGVDTRSIRRYLTGERGISEPTAILLRLAVSGKITVADIEECGTAE